MAGLIDTIKLAAVLIFAIPAALAGLEFLTRGDTLVGATLLGLAIGLVALKQFLTLPTDIPGMIVKRVVGTVIEEPETKSESEPKRD